MVRSQPRPHSIQRRRRLRAEILEPRRLLAADVGDHAHGPAGVDVELGRFTEAEFTALENVALQPELSSKTPPSAARTDGTHESDVLTFVLDFKESAEPTTSDIFGNVVGTFDVTGYGFAVGDFDTVADTIFQNVRDDFFTELIGTDAGPVGEDLAINFMVGDIGSAPVGVSEYYFIQIGEGISGPHAGGPLGVAGSSVVRSAGGVGPSGVSVGDVVGSVFTDEINTISVAPPGALTDGSLYRASHAVGGTLSHEIGHTLSLSHIDSAFSQQPTFGVPPIMGTGASDLTNAERLSDRQFSLTGFDSESGGAFRQHISQLVGSVGLHDIPAGSVSGIVYTDLDQNGVRQESDLPLFGATIYADYNNNNILDSGEPSDISNSLGEYTVSGITRDHVMIKRSAADNPSPTSPLAPTLVITEFSSDLPDFVELQNVSGATVDTSGWTVLVSGGFGNEQINLRSPGSFTLPDSVAAGGVVTTTDDPEDPNYFGSDLTFLSANAVWVLLLDDEGNVQDSFFAGYSEAEISTFEITHDGATIRSTDLDWVGTGVSLATGVNTYQREGNADTDRKLDWELDTATQDFRNFGMATTFGPESSGYFLDQVSGSSAFGFDFGDTEFGGTSLDVFFAATLPDGQRELFRSNGLSSETTLIRNISGGVSSDPDDLTFTEDRVYFTATLPSGERELFKTDGTGSGTALVRNISGSRSSDPQELTEVDQRLYFTAVRPDGQRELFRTRGTASTTVQVADLSGPVSSNPSDLVSIGDTVFFAATGSDGQRELYSSLGTASTTSMVRDISGSRSSNPEDLTVVDDQVFFTAELPTGERELFVTDGTSSGTRLTRNLSGSQSAAPEQMTAFNGRLFFVATLPDGQKEMFFSRGTRTSTALLDNLSGSRSSSPNRLTVAGGRLFFVAATSDGQRELHSTTGTRSETGLVRDLSGGVSSLPTQLTAVGASLVFSASLPSGERELFRSDGTAAGTRLVSNRAGSDSAQPTDFAAVDGGVIYASRLASGERELHFSDLTRNGTRLIRDLSGSESSNPKELLGNFRIPDPRFFIEDDADSAGSLDLATFAPAPLPDTNDDGQVTARDALAIINYMTRIESNLGESEEGEAIFPASLDVNGDGVVSARDALMVVNYMSSVSSAGGVDADDDDEIGQAQGLANDLALTDEFLGSLTSR